MAGSDSSAVEFDVSLEELLSVVEDNLKTKASNIRPKVETICKHAYKHGVVTQALRRLVDFVTLPSGLDQTSRGLILKSLYPSGRVPSDVIHKAVTALGHGAQKPPSSIQVALLRWLIMVHPVLEDLNALCSLYNVFFNMLDRMDIRAPLCHLLAMLTRSKHIKPFRQGMLRQLALSVPREPALEKLMRIYERFGPSGSGTKGSSIVFPHPDPVWGAQLQEIQSRTGATTMSPGLYSQPVTFSQRDLNGGSTAKHRSRCAFDIRSIDDIVNGLEHFNTVSLSLQNLEDRLLHQFLVLRPHKENVKQLDDLLSPLFERQLEALGRGEDLRKDILDHVLAHTASTKTLPRPAEIFLEKFLPSWNGHRHQGVLLELLSYLPSQPFADLQITHLNALEAAILESNPLTTLLSFYTSLLANWTTTLHSSAPPDPPQTFPILSLIAHVNLLLYTILTNPIAHPSATPAILSYLTTLLPLVQPPLSLAIPPPPPLLIYTLLFTSPTLPTLHTVSSLLAIFKIAFEPSTTSPTTGAQPNTRPSQQDIHTLNATLIDICNLIFRSRAFNTSDAHALGCLLDSTVRTSLESYVNALDLGPGMGLGAVFGLSCHPALAALSIAALRELEDADEERKGSGGAKRHAGPVSQRSLGVLAREGGVKVSWKEYRVLVLRWLEALGVGGVSDLGRATMRGLGMGGPGTGGQGGRESMEGVAAA